MNAIIQQARKSARKQASVFMMTSVVPSNYKITEIYEKVNHSNHLSQ